LGTQTQNRSKSLKTTLQPMIQTGTHFGIHQRTRPRNGAVWSTSQTNKHTAHPRPTPAHSPLSRAGHHCRCPHPPMSSAAVLFLLRLLRRRFDLHPSFTLRALSSRAMAMRCRGAGGGGGRASPPHGEGGREQRRGSPTTAPPQTAMVTVSSSPLPRSRWPEEAGGGGGLNAEDTILRRRGE
jgi:hypothetical protein